MADDVEELLSDIDSMTADYVATVKAGGFEPDGVVMALGAQVSNDPAVLGYGIDLWCGFTGNGAEIDIDDNASEVDPFSSVAVEQAIARRLSTPSGGILTDEEELMAVGEDPDYGFNLIQLLSVGLDRTKIQAYQDLAAAECMKDDRLASCTVTITQTGPESFRIHVAGETKTGATYDLVMPLNGDTREQFT